jgi:hypothetical protein
MTLKQDVHLADSKTDFKVNMIPMAKQCSGSGWQNRNDWSHTDIPPIPALPWYQMILKVKWL